MKVTSLGASLTVILMPGRPLYLRCTSLRPGGVENMGALGDIHNPFLSGNVAISLTRPILCTLYSRRNSPTHHWLDPSFHNFSVSLMHIRG